MLGFIFEIVVVGGGWGVLGGLGKLRGLIGGRVIGILLEVLFLNGRLFLRLLKDFRFLVGLVKGVIFLRFEKLVWNFFVFLDFLVIRFGFVLGVGVGFDLLFVWLMFFCCYFGFVGLIGMLCVVWGVSGGFVGFVGGELRFIVWGLFKLLFVYVFWFCYWVIFLLLLLLLIIIVVVVVVFFIVVVLVFFEFFWFVFVGEVDDVWFCSGMNVWGLNWLF